MLSCGGPSGIPEEFEFVAPVNLSSPMRIGKEHFIPMYWNLDVASGYFFRSHPPLWFQPAGPQPGFYFGTTETPAPSVAAAERFGRIAFGHSQLRGHQNWVGAVTEGARAAREALALL
jgi:hypothetical protein